MDKERHLSAQARNGAERETSRPRVSVITVFLNAERFISEAVESILAQDFCNFELILVDDGSTDESTIIACDYAARYAPIIRYLEHPAHENRGISASRNLGLVAARGEFVAFIDADDVWEKTKLTQQLAIMEAFPELGMVCGAARYWSSWNGGNDEIVPTGHRQNAVIQPPEAALALYPLGKASAPCPSDLLLRQKMVTSLGGFAEHFTGMYGLYEDQVFLAKLYLTSPVYFSDNVWLNYRLHADSCMAEAKSQGRYHEVRLHFLNWLEAYLRTMTQPPDRRVFAALRHALWPYRHPRMHAATSRLHQILSFAWRSGRQLGRFAAAQLHRRDV
jgi:glycosyltransferase involved in cell wall biosynthesis